MGNVQRTQYDERGNAGGILSEFTAAAGNKVSLARVIRYDALNRAVAINDQAGNSLVTLYDDRNSPVEITNSLGQTIRLFYDVNRELIRTALLKSDGTESTINIWHRDTVGRLVKYEDAQGNTTDFSFDDRGNPVGITYPDGGTVEREFNELGLVRSEKDPNGTKTTFQYNNLSQLVKLAFQVAPGVNPTEAIILEYDAFGRKQKVTQGGSVIVRSHDAFDRVIEEKQATSTVQKIFDDLVGSVLLRFPDEREDLYTLDPMGRVKDVVFHKRGTANLLATYSVGSKLASYTQDGFLLTSRKLCNGVSTNFSYDHALRLSGIGVTDGSRTLDRKLYLFDSEGRRNLVVRSGLPASDRLFQYDELSRVTQSYTGQLVQGNLPQLPDQASTDAFIRNSVDLTAATQAESFQLLNDDTRLQWQVNQEIYTPSYNLSYQLRGLSTSAGVTRGYIYDKNGNRIADDDYQYVYDALDNLTKVIRKNDNSIVVQNKFDGESRLIAADGGGVHRDYLYDDLRAIQETDDQGNITQVTFGRGLDELVLRSNDVGNLFGHQDCIQSLKMLTDDSGKAIAYFDFDAFGNPRAFDEAKSALPLNRSPVRPLFAGRPYIQEMKLYDFRRRVYDPPRLIPATRSV